MSNRNLEINATTCFLNMYFSDVDLTIDVRFHLATSLEKGPRKRNAQMYLRKNLHLNRQFRIDANMRWEHISQYLLICFTYTYVQVSITVSIDLCLKAFTDDYILVLNFPLILRAILSSHNFYRTEFIVLCSVKIRTAIYNLSILYRKTRKRNEMLNTINFPI